MIAMILAAGRGERLRPLTDTIPKALVEVCGQSLLERHLRNLSKAGVTDVVINLGWLGEQIVERVASGGSYGLNVVYSPEGDNILETGGGIQRALPMLGTEPFAVINADIFTDMPVPDVTLRESEVGHLVLVPKPDYTGRGDFDLKNGLIEKGDTPRFTFSGVAIYKPEFFSGCKAGRFSVTPMLFDAADRRQLQGSLYEGQWADVGTQERLEQIDCQ